MDCRLAAVNGFVTGTDPHFTRSEGKAHFNCEGRNASSMNSNKNPTI